MPSKEHDAGGFLAAMLQRVQAERRDGGGVRMAEDAEHAAFLVQAVLVQVDVLVDALGEGEAVFGSIHRPAFRAPAGVT